MNEPTQPIDLSDLRAADPVRLADLPRASDPAAQLLLENTVAVQSPASSAGSLRSRLPILGAVAAVLVVIAAGFAILSPTNAAPALATVKAAAQEAAAAQSGRVTTTFGLTGSSSERGGAIAGTAELTYNGDDFSVLIALDEVPAEFQRSNGFLDSVETRVVDGVVYAKGGPLDQWVAFEVPELMTRQVIDTIDPRSVLETVQTLVAVEVVGVTEVNGEQLTHYRTVIDLADESLASSGWMSGLQSQVDIDAEGTVTVDLFIGSDDRLRRLDVTGQVASTSAADPGAASFAISTVFADLGQVDPITAPEGVEPGATLDGFLGGEGGG